MIAWLAKTKRSKGANVDATARLRAARAAIASRGAARHPMDSDPAEAVDVNAAGAASAERMILEPLGASRSRRQRHRGGPFFDERFVGPGDEGAPPPRRCSSRGSSRDSFSARRRSWASRARASGVALREAADAARARRRLFFATAPDPQRAAGPGGSPAVPGTPAAGGARGDGARRVPRPDHPRSELPSSHAGRAPARSGAGAPERSAAEEAHSRRRSAARLRSADAMAAAVAAGVAGSAASGPAPPACGARAAAAGRGRERKAESAERGEPLARLSRRASRRLGTARTMRAETRRRDGAVFERGKEKGPVLRGGLRRALGQVDEHEPRFRMKPARSTGCGLCQRAYAWRTRRVAARRQGAPATRRASACAWCATKSLDERRVSRWRRRTSCRAHAFRRAASSTRLDVARAWQSVKQYQLEALRRTGCRSRPANSSGTCAPWEGGRVCVPRVCVCVCVEREVPNKRLTTHAQKITRVESTVTVCRIDKVEPARA